ncbi:unnamed protein product [Linum trigynum]|uniref:Uncharacterized protein n=1 Tax=Linum trigynum TaxID=586398 RepID=A0AAV2GMY9_9ROSI
MTPSLDSSARSCCCKVKTFGIEIQDKKGADNVAQNHLSQFEAHLVDNFVKEIDDSFLGVRLLALWLVESVTPWYSEFVNYLVGKQLPKGMSTMRSKSFSRPKVLLLRGSITLQDGSRRSDPEVCDGARDGRRTISLLRGTHCGYHGGNNTGRKVLQSSFYWPSLFKDANVFSHQRDHCQRSGKNFALDSMPHKSFVICEIFGVWGIDFMGPFPSSYGNLYILVVVDYVSKWAEAQPCRPMMHDVCVYF